MVYLELAGSLLVEHLVLEELLEANWGLAGELPAEYLELVVYLELGGLLLVELLVLVVYSELEESSLVGHLVIGVLPEANLELCLVSMEASPVEVLAPVLKVLDLVPVLT